MNYSYTNSEDAASSKGASSKNRYKVNHLAGQDALIEEINALDSFENLTSLRRA